VSDVDEPHDRERHGNFVSLRYGPPSPGART
jgi:hypothetical protein